MPLRLTAASPRLANEMVLHRNVNAGLGIVNWVARHGKLLNVPDVSNHPLYVDAVGPSIRSELCVPLLADGNVVGVMNLESDRLDGFSDADERLMISAADYIANAIHVVQLHGRLKTLSYTDALTGLDNHRVFFDRLVREARRSVASQTPLSVAILDVNNLKEINDSHGHLAGDAALRASADILRRSSRPEDVVARYGGDEFAMILPRITAEEAWAIVENIAAALAASEFEIDGVTLPLPAASWGIATAPEDGHRSVDLIGIADERMYLHKNMGRI